MALLLLVSPALGQGKPVNLALHQPYSLSPPPNYPRCTDDSDLIQLTDGRKDRANWRVLPTVGWRDPDGLPTIVVDLGAVKSVSEVRVYTVGGGSAGVYHPEAMLVMVSDDGLNFQPVALKDDTKHDILPTISRNGRRFVLQAKDLATRARYVQITLLPYKRYFFLDEVEVFEGRHHPDSVAFALNEPVESDSAVQIIQLQHRLRALNNRFKEIEASAQASADKRATSLHQRLQKQMQGLNKFDAVSYEKAASTLRRLRGVLLEASGGEPLRWRQIDPFAVWDPESIDGFETSPRPSVELESWIGEYESFAVELLNATTEEMPIQVDVSPVRSPGGRDATGWITVRRAAIVETRAGQSVADPLVKLADKNVLVAAGGRAKLFFTVRQDPAPAAEPGDHRFVIRLAGSNSVVLTLPVTWRVHPIRFPARPALRTVTWAYPERLGLAQSELSEVYSDLASHHAHEHVIPASSCPKASLNADGRVVVDFRAMRRAISHAPDARTYLFFWALKPRRLYALGRLGDWMSKEWKANMADFLDQWIAELGESGIGYDRFAMYPFDENLGDEFYDLARFIKAHDSRIRIFANSAGDRRKDRFSRFIGLVDIWCLPEDRPASKEARRALAGHNGHEVWRYATKSDARTLSSYRYYRLMPWRSFAAGDKGCGFWTYAGRRQPGACSGWDDASCAIDRWSVVYQGKGAPVDCQGETVVPSVRWEAWRAGVEDFEYLTTLKNAIDGRRQSGKDRAALDNAQRTLDTAVKNVLENESDPLRANLERENLSRAIAALGG